MLITCNAGRCWWTREKLEIHISAPPPTCSPATWERSSESGQTGWWQLGIVVEVDHPQIEHHQAEHVLARCGMG